MKLHLQIYQHCERLYRHYELAFQRFFIIPLISDSLKVIIFVLALHWAFHSIINFGRWTSGLLSRVLLSGDVCLTTVSLVNIHKPCLSVYVRTSEILYSQHSEVQIENVNEYPNTFFNTLIIILSLTL